MAVGKKSNRKRLTTLHDVPQVMTYLQRIDAQPRGLLSAVVTDYEGGYRRDVAVIRFTRQGEIRAASDYSPTADEAKEIASAFENFDIPEPARCVVRPDLPEQLMAVPRDDLYEFFDEHGLFVMLHQRVMERDATKGYRPWTYWSDGEWRMTEPEGLLPLYNAHRIKEAGVVWIHEGAKAARYAQWLADAETPEARRLLEEHPFGDAMQPALHVGWIGGALSPHRTDFSAINRLGVRVAYIVSDNDDAGRSAMPKIAEQLRIRTWHIQVTKEWPVGWDFADPFPAGMFKLVDNVRRYVGPPLQAVEHHATWATDQVPVEGSKKLQAVLRSHFRGSWMYLEELMAYVSTDNRAIVRDQASLNKLYAPLSHTRRISDLIDRDFHGRTFGLAYRPYEETGVFTVEDRPMMNIHTKSNIRPIAGDVSVFEDFLTYLFPVENERHLVKRWLATLIAHPEVRMPYGLLLVSETQGTGKTTLAMEIIAPIIGRQNVSTPSEREIVESQFNSWVACKRLIVVHEIYAGHNWKAYNNLKSIITERHVRVNEKHEKPFEVENWSHIIASSNSKRALRIDRTDRRWLFPRLTETKWEPEKFTGLFQWISAGGLHHIADWAQRFGDYVRPGESAPATQQKDDIIEATRSDGEIKAMALAEAMNQCADAICVTMRDIEGWVRSAVGGRMQDRPDDLRRAMVDAGVVFSEALKVRGSRQMVAMNQACLRTVETLQHEAGRKLSDQLVPEARHFIQEHCQSPTAFDVGSI